MLAWLKRKPTETRSAGYSDAILAAFESGAATKAASTASTAAIEAVAGLLARTMCSASVTAPPWARKAISPVWLAMTCRSLVREGEALSLIGMDDHGDLLLHPAGHWHWRGSALSERTWVCTATVTGPTDSQTRQVQRDQAVWLQWARSPAAPHLGRSPHRLASLASKAAAEVEKALGNEAAGPVAQLLTVPEGHDVDSEDDSDPMATLRSGIAGAAGKALLLETVAGGYGDRATAPHRDWVASRLGPNPPAPLVQLAQHTFNRLVAACGASPALFDTADGTAQREALRRWHLGTVLPVARIIETELTDRLDAEVKLRFDLYATDLAGRAGAFKRLVDGGMSLETAAAISGVLMADDGG